MHGLKTRATNWKGRELSKKKPVKTPTPAKRINSDSPMDVGLLEQMVKLMAANDLNTVDVRDGDKRVILKRGAIFAAPNVSSGAYPYPQAAPPSGNPGATSGAASQASGAGSAGAAAPADDTAGLVAIKSPMVGTFYS